MGLYVFAPSWMGSQGAIPRFSKCNGNTNTAKLETTGNSLEGIQIGLVLQVTNPSTEPASANLNEWTLQLYRGSEPRPANQDKVQGYSIQSMPAVYFGNNRFGGMSSGFFRFTPNRRLALGGYLEITPPQNRGFNLRCTGVYMISLPEQPLCQSGGVNGKLELELPNTGLEAETEYVFGIGVDNPTTWDVGSLYKNEWGLMLLSHNKNTVDARMNIPGLNLVEIPLRFSRMGWSSPESGSMSNVQLELIATKDLEIGRLDYFEVESPTGFTFNMNTDLVMATGLPLRTSGLPYHVTGMRLEVLLEPMSVIPEGTIRISFAVQNPTKLPPGNTWDLKAFSSTSSMMIFSETIRGYLWGEASPFTVAGVMSEGSDCVRRFGTGVLVFSSLLTLSTLSLFKFIS